MCSFFFQAEDGIRDHCVTGVQTCALPISRAWAKGARRVWVHTCSLDGPTALANYQGRGFRVYDQRAQDRKSTRLNSSHTVISYAVFCLKKKNKKRKS